MAHSERLLRPDNHELFDHVRLMILSRRPVFTMAEIAAEFGVGVDDLCRWILGTYREPAILPRSRHQPRDAKARAVLAHLREREASLVTLATQAPEQLAAVQRRIKAMEKVA